MIAATRAVAAGLGQQRGAGREHQPSAGSGRRCRRASARRRRCRRTRRRACRRPRAPPRAGGTPTPCRQQLAEHLRAPDAQTAHGDVVRRDAALGDHPRRARRSAACTTSVTAVETRRAIARLSSASSPRRGCGSCRAARRRRGARPSRVRRSRRRRRVELVTSSSISCSPPRACAAATWRLVRPTCEPTTRARARRDGRRARVVRRQRLARLEPGERAHERRAGPVEERAARSPAARARRPRGRSSLAR